MSNIQEAAALIDELGAATMDDLVPLMPDCTRKQIRSALTNAVSAGLIVCDGKVGPRTGPGGIGQRPSTYRRKPEPARPRPAASVWEYAAQASA